MPALLKEKLLARLARYCTVGYPLAVHAVRLRERGVSAEGVLALLDDPGPVHETEARDLEALAQEMGEASDWTDERVHVLLLRASELFFARPARAERCLHGIHRLLDPARYLSWVSLLEFAKANHLWCELHPEISSRSDPEIDAGLKALCAETPRLEMVLQGYAEVVRRERADLQAAERGEMHSRLLLADRLVTVGTLAAGTAHEVNNPLAYVLANLAFALEELQWMSDECAGLPGASALATRISEVLEALTQAREGAERVRNIVRDLRTFARPDDDVRAYVDLNKILEVASGMAFEQIRTRARLTTQLGEIPAVEANRLRLTHVFVNLLLNAVEAVPEGNPSANEIRISTWADRAGRVVAEVRDTGVGIPPEIRGRIFDPFFTTKPIGVGTGLGLSICHGTVASLGGVIEVDSTVGKGSAFRVILPASGAEVLEESVVAPWVVGEVRMARILIVDPDPKIGEAVRRILSREHDVIAVQTASEALESVGGGERFDVIFCDLALSEPSALELHGHLGERVPDQAARMVFLTPGTLTEGTRAFLDALPNRRIEKPFQPESLRAAVREALARSS
jgi:signal transduction histidine kinase/CheY-like chemotaxis protein